MSNPDVPGFGEGLENQVPLEEAPDPDDSPAPDDEPPDATDSRDDDEVEPSEAEVLHDEPPVDQADDRAEEGGDVADEGPAGPPA